jgi:hypothetical protein
MSAILPKLKKEGEEGDLELERRERFRLSPTHYYALIVHISPPLYSNLVQ